MERLVYVLIVFSLFGSSCSVSKRAFRDLNRKVDLIRTSLQQQIGDLTFEVLDLKSQLESERTRANKLEELLNGTGALQEIDASTEDVVDRREGEDLTRQASADICAMMSTAIQQEKKRARQFESTVTQTITKVLGTTESLRRDIEHLQRTVETVADDAQKCTRGIEDIQNELTLIRDEADVNNNTVADLLGVVEKLTGAAQKSARDIEDIQNELTIIHDEVDVSNDAKADLLGIVKNVTNGVQKNARDIAAIPKELMKIRGDAVIRNDTSKTPNFQHDRHVEAKNTSENVKQIPEQDCGALYAKGSTTSGVYVISPDGGLPFSAYCDMTNGGWTVIQRRIDGAVKFDRTWDEYVHGFGNINLEYWLGLEKIHRLTKDGAEIYFDLGKYDGTKEYAHYRSFTVHNAANLYKMNVDASGYNGSIDDLFSNHNNMMFTTKDRDYDISGENCAKYFKGGGWWYNSCFRLGNLNGLFGEKTTDGICYFDGKRYFYVKTVTIKLKHRPR